MLIKLNPTTVVNLLQVVDIVRQPFAGSTISESDPRNTYLLGLSNSKQYLINHSQYCLILDNITLTSFREV